MADLKYQAINIPSAIEAVLFVSPEPLTPAQLSNFLEISTAEVEEALVMLDNDLQSRGLRLQRNGTHCQLTTAPEMAEIIERYLGLEPSGFLSHAAMETLAIIAYQQPVTRPYIEGIRGVSSDGVMKSLLAKNLILEVGRADGPGRPILYATTSDFLQHFGINSLSDLPSLNLEGASFENEHDGVLKG